MTAHRRLRVRIIELAAANAYIERLHRHHKSVVGHRFSIACWSSAVLVGVAICGRPVAKTYDPLAVLEVTRLCTDGTEHVCSKLYGACARIAKEMGFDRIQTYILATETGTSLRAAGWTREAETTGGQWARPGDWSNPAQAVLFERNRTDQPTCGKVRWAKVFSVSAGAIT